MKKKARKDNYLLAAIFFLGLSLRILGTNPGYLNTHPDESTIADSINRILIHGNFEPLGFYYGSLLGYLYSLLSLLIFVPQYIFVYLPFNYISSIKQGYYGALGCLQNNQELLVCLSVRSRDYFDYWARYNTAFVSSLAIVAIYFLAKRLFNKNVGIASAFLTAINYRHVLSSNFSLADAPLSLFVILSIIFSVNILKNRSYKSYIVAGIGLAMSLSVKYFIYTIPTFVVCHTISSWEKLSRSKNKYLKFFKNFLSIKPLIATVVTVLGFVIINPYMFTRIEKLQTEFKINGLRYGGIEFSDNFLKSVINTSFHNLNLYPLTYFWEYGLGKILFIAVVIGFIYCIFRYFRNTVIISSTLLSFIFVFFLIFKSSLVRNYSSVIPLILIFPSVLIFDLSKKISNTNKSIIFFWFLIFVIGAHSLYSSFSSSYSLSKEQNSTKLNTWINENIEDGSIVMQTWGSPIPSNKDIKVINPPPLIERQLTIEQMQKQKIDWAIISSDQVGYINDRKYNLLVKDLSKYRVAEFIKPEKISVDPAFIVIKIPENNNVGVDSYPFYNKPIPEQFFDMPPL